MRWIMKVKGIIFAGAVCLCVLLSFIAGDEVAGRIRAQFVGVDVCKNCHGSESIGNQYRVWRSSPHSNAFLVLRTGKSREIAKNAGVAEPYNDRKCLKCHTTGGGRTEATKDEGVGCEACHGPGSEYFEFSNHASYLDRESAYRKAVSRGMYPILGVKGIKARERVCRHCHLDERPCAPSDPEEKKRRRLSLSLIADLPPMLKHTLRR